MGCGGHARSAANGIATWRAGGGFSLTRATDLSITGSIGGAMLRYCGYNTAGIRAAQDHEMVWKGCLDSSLNAQQGTLLPLLVGITNTMEAVLGLGRNHC